MTTRRNDADHDPGAADPGVPVTPFPLIAPYNVTPPVNSHRRPIFRVPADALTAPAITGRYSATFTASITYESKVELDRDPRPPGTTPSR